MSARYSRIPAEDVESNHGLTFDYSSAFTFNNDPGRKYDSVFTYSSATRQQQLGDDQGYDVEVASRNLLDRACYYLMTVIVYAVFVVTFPISVWFAIKVVPNFERLVVFRWGQLQTTKGPGMVFVMPFVDRCHKVDVRMKAFTVPPQQVITGDGGIIEVGADVYYRIVSPELSITNVQNLDKSTRILLQTSLLNLLVRLPLSKIEGHRNGISQDVQDNCNKTSQAWGIEICRLDISQIKVLQKPPANQPKPSIVMPPGLAAFGNFGTAAQSLSSGSVPEAFQQLASAFLAAQGLSYQSETPNPKQPDLVKPAPTSYDNTIPSTLSASHGHDVAVAAAAGYAGAASGVCAASATGGTSPSVLIQDILQAAQCVLSETLVRKVNAVYQFQLHGEGGSVYFLDLKHGSGSVGEGVWLGEGEADASLMLTMQDLQLMLCGQLKPFQAYMSGRLRVSGDLAAALRLETFVDKVVAQSQRRAT